jgi:hypothetical protein
MRTSQPIPTREVCNGKEFAISLNRKRFSCNKTAFLCVKGVVAIFLVAVETLYRWDVWSYTVGEEAQS